MNKGQKLKKSEKNYSRWKSHLSKRSEIFLPKYGHHYKKEKDVKFGIPIRFIMISPWELPHVF